MPKYLRVKDNETGHEFSVPEGRFNDALMQKLDKPATGSDGRPLPMKPKTTVAKAAAKKSDTPSGKSGQQAETDKE